MVDAMGDGCRERPLDLDRAAGRDHRGGEQRDDVPGSAGEQTGRGGSRSGRSARGGGTTTGHAGSGRGAATAKAEKVGDHADRAQRGSERRQLAADAADVGAELAAALALVQVPPG